MFSNNQKLEISLSYYSPDTGMLTSNVLVSAEESEVECSKCCLWCKARWFLWKKALPHLSQTCCLTSQLPPLCRLLCWARPCFWEKHLPQSGHIWGFGFGCGGVDGNIPPVDVDVPTELWFNLLMAVGCSGVGHRKWAAGCWNAAARPHKSATKLRSPACRR